MSDISATRKAALWVGVVFLLGAALGAVVGYSYEHHLVSAANAPLSEPVRRAQRGEQLPQALKLNSAPSQQVGAILLQHHTAAETTHEPIDAPVEQVSTDGR